MKKTVRPVEASADAGRGWHFSVDLEQPGSTPTFARIADAISSDIARGRIGPGFRLPGARSLAVRLGVHRNTVAKAYRELQAQGWIETRRASGSVVSARMPTQRPRGGKSRPGGNTAYRLAPLSDPRFGEVLSSPAVGQSASEVRYLLTGGRPDPRLFPAELLARAYRRVLRSDGQRLLDYGSAFGDTRLRRALATMLRERRGLSLGPDGLLVTRGSQMALYLVFGALLEPGDRVAIERLGYPPAWSSMRAFGAELHPFEVDSSGLDVDALIAAHRTTPLRAVYITPHHQYPNGAVLSPGRRARLLDFAQAEGVAVVEDDYDYEYHYEGRPVLPLASRDPGGAVIYIGSLSKVLSPGLRVGYVAAPQALLERLARMRLHIDRQGALSTEAALAELMEEGEIQRHVLRTRRIYEGRRDAFVEALRLRLGDRLRFEVPAGGIAMWLQAPGTDVPAWAERARARGVGIVSGHVCDYMGGHRDHLRVGFARHDEQELHEAVRLLASALSSKACRGA